MITVPIHRLTSRRSFARALAACAVFVVLACGAGASAAASAADDVRAATLQGFTADLSVNRGQTVHFKIDTDAPAYGITIYRLDDSGVAGTQAVASLPAPPAPQVQPPCIPSQDTGLADCSNWAESASWTVPADAVPGIYIAMLLRPDTNDSSHIVFVVQDDGHH